ncbi:MAG TPA: sigma-70 family RNA polymerase sigma factor [Clostridia bacterium]|nr:sigma-70 family RNA polymerase sigma factor [Clostridia bacterium]
MLSVSELEFTRIYQDYYKSVCSYINKTMNNNVLAEDLTQETFIKVLGALEDFDRSKPLAPWLYRIARNTCIDYCRKSKRTLELLDEFTCYDKEDNSPENIVLTKEKQAVIKDALSGISQKYKKAVILRDFNELSYKDIASALRLNEASAKILIHRGRKQFRKAYSEAYQNVSS